MSSDSRSARQICCQKAIFLEESLDKVTLSIVRDSQLDTDLILYLVLVDTGLTLNCFVLAPSK